MHVNYCNSSIPTFVILILSIFSNVSFSQDLNHIHLDFDDAVLNKRSVKIVVDDRFENDKGMSLKEGEAEAIRGERKIPDISFRIKIRNPGLYEVRSYTLTDEWGKRLMDTAKNKFGSLFMRFQINSNRPDRRVVVVPWNRPSQKTGIFELSKTDTLNIWLPKGVRLGYLDLKKYKAPPLPLAAKNYKPLYTPPSSHPRLWVTRESLPDIKKNLHKKENRSVWQELKRNALAPYPYKFNPDENILYDENLETAAKKKAFYYLMTGDKKIGREADSLMLGYISNVDFGNLLDITRQIGRAIYTCALVYDWTYDLLDTEEKDRLRKRMMDLAIDMEVGWPPFKKAVVIGHGNEAGISRDLLSMSIAIYDEDKKPYQYVAYRIFEELIPMKKFEYRSERHSQGILYGAYRSGWDLHAAWILKRMTGKEIFDNNIKELRNYWLYMKAPNGQMLRDGDKMINLNWKGSLLPFFMLYSYSKDPIMKAEFIRRGGMISDSVLFLLLNDPSLIPDFDMSSLPLTKEFKSPLGGMVARTGWDIGPESDDVVAEIKGGGYKFGNHQHADAGAIQIYYRGFELGDIGEYRFNGIPYDFGFNKRSIAHSLMLVYDPNEKFNHSEANDGGQRFILRGPEKPEEIMKNPQFDNGTILSSNFGPSKVRPTFSYFSVDLEGAYSDKVKEYHRSFCFINLKREDVPAAIILADNILTSDSSSKKFWQINSINPPKKTKNGFMLYSLFRGRKGKAYVNMLSPALDDRKMITHTGKEATSTFNIAHLEPPYPGKEVTRSLITPLTAALRDTFLTVFQIVKDHAEPLEIKNKKTDESDVLYIGNKVVRVNLGISLIDKTFQIDIDKDSSEVYLSGLAAGAWRVADKDGRTVKYKQVEDGRNTLYFKGDKGKYTVEKISKLSGRRPQTPHP